MALFWFVRALSCVVVSLLFLLPSLASAAPKSEFLTGEAFTHALDGTISASWSNVPLREILQRVSTEQRVAIVLDRRIDPTPELEIDLGNVPLRTGVERIADSVGADVSVLGSTIYMGPPEATRRLRTLAALRDAELRHQVKGIKPARRLELVRKLSFAWKDLESPADVLSQIAEGAALEVSGAPVPHDLWGAATLPDADVAEALTIVLLQFDQTFQWTDRANGIELIPAPETVAVSKQYSPGKLTVDEAAKQWTEAVPGMEAKIEGRKLLIQGTVEQHETLERLIHPERFKDKMPEGSAQPLAQREFTMRVVRIPASAILEKLELSGITFDYDEQALKDAGIDLDQPVSVDLNKAKAEAFFEAILGPLGASFKIDGTTVRIVAKGQK